MSYDWCSQCVSAHTHHTHTHTYHTQTHTRTHITRTHTHHTHITHTRTHITRTHTHTLTHTHRTHTSQVTLFSCSFTPHQHTEKGACTCVHELALKIPALSQKLRVCQIPHEFALRRWYAPNTQGKYCTWTQLGTDIRPGEERALFVRRFFVDTEGF